MGYLQRRKALAGRGDGDCEVGAPGGDGKRGREGVGSELCLLPPAHK